MIPSSETNSKFTPENWWQWKTICYKGDKKKQIKRLDFRGSVYTILSFRYLHFMSCHCLTLRQGTWRCQCWQWRYSKPPLWPLRPSWEVHQPGKQMMGWDGMGWMDRDSYISMLWCVCVYIFLVNVLNINIPIFTNANIRSLYHIYDLSLTTYIYICKCVCFCETWIIVCTSNCIMVGFYIETGMQLTL